MKSKWITAAALTAAVVALCAGSALAQSNLDSLALAEYEALYGGDEPGFFAKLFADIVAIVTMLALLGIILTPIVHMLVTIFKTRSLKNAVSAERMLALRLKRGMPEASTEEENLLCDELLQEAYLCCTVVETNEEGQEVHYPKNMREVLRMRKLVKAAGNVLPTDAETLQRYNDYRMALYENMQRSFNGSNKLLWLGGLVAVGMSFFALPAGIFFALGTLLYYMASCVPQFMIERKAARGGGGGWFTTMLVALGIGALSSGYTVRTTYTDGSTSDDNSAHFIALAIGIMILFAVACTIFIWAAISYLRNYVFYI